MGTFGNIYDLCDNRTIKIVPNKLLRKRLEIKIRSLPHGGIKKLSENIKVSYITLWRDLRNKTAIPLEIFKELKINIPQNIWFESGPNRNRVKLPRKITAELSSIIGAYMVDGHLRERKTTWNKNKNAMHYEFIIREEYKSIIDSFSNWFSKTFFVNILPKDRKNHYEFYISNKVIFLYFTKILELKNGRKTETTYVPEYIKSANKNIKKSFLQGIYMFDGGVDYRTAYVNLITRSFTLFQEVQPLLHAIGIMPDYCSKKPDKYGRWKIRIRKKEKLKLCLKLFEKGTEKWFRIMEHLYGLNQSKSLNRVKKQKTLEGFIDEIDRLYPRKRWNSVTFSDVIRIVARNENIGINDISHELKRGKTVVYEYVRKLEKWGIFSSTTKNNQRVYTIHENWRK
ncbi:MAG: LAGLIDADG family homing endonuclease [Nanoarchaeota archaeon]|nr:LAGLIDADG family homing endonuclease [Nanoarchaeota archaeon]